MSPTTNGTCDYCSREAIMKITEGADSIWYCSRHAHEFARDWRAERWLIQRHDTAWTLGNATKADWTAAYAAVDAS